MKHWRGNIFIDCQSSRNLKNYTPIMIVQFTFCIILWFVAASTFYKYINLWLCLKKRTHNKKFVFYKNCFGTLSSKEKTHCHWEHRCPEEGDLGRWWRVGVRLWPVTEVRVTERHTREEFTLHVTASCDVFIRREVHKPRGIDREVDTIRAVPNVGHNYSYRNEDKIHV